jgi:hypothetical protein
MEMPGIYSLPDMESLEQEAKLTTRELINLFLYFRNSNVLQSHHE